MEWTRNIKPALDDPPTDHHIMIIRILKSSGTSILEPRQISLLHSRLLLLLPTRISSREITARELSFGGPRPGQRNVLLYVVIGIEEQAAVLYDRC